jgi:hypothetical protein
MGNEMAYFNQERKTELAPLVKAILKKYKVKGSLAVRNHSTFVLNIKSGRIDFIENFISTNSTSIGRRMSDDQVEYIRKHKSLDVNPYWFKEHFNGNALKFLTEVFAVMNRGNHDNSDIQSDYFDVGWYVDVNIGSWKKPYTVE